MARKPKQSEDRPDYHLETRFGAPRCLVAGVDEVGRGCIAGPVVAAAVVFPLIPQEEFPVWVFEIRDSKALNPEDRNRLADSIQAWAAACFVAEASVEEIEKLNILHASLLAMSRAIEQAQHKCRGNLGHVLVDGNRLPTSLPCPGTAIVKGDARSLSIAAASIVAKVHRDKLMVQAASRYPGYGFEIHKAYPTPMHLTMLGELGATPIHRRSFGPVKALSRS